MANSEVHMYKFDVKVGRRMNAITRVLEKAKTEGGVEDYTVTFEKQEVLVTGSIPYDKRLGKLEKTGKGIRSGETVFEETIPEETVREETILEETVLE